MRKTSAYARKRQHNKVPFNGAEWINVIGRCRPYTEEPVIGSWLPGTASIATPVLVEARMAYQRMKDGLLDWKDTDEFDMLAHVVGVAKLRAFEIGGRDEKTNYLLEPLYLAEDALHRVRARWESSKRWGFDGPGLQAIPDALDIYDAIVMQSSPQQMANATEQRIALLKKLRQQS